MSMTVSLLAAEAIDGEHRHSDCISGMVISITYAFIILPIVSPSITFPYSWSYSTQSVNTTPNNVLLAS